ncbi:hypothetical protein DUNSADRAFT_3529 [Dunaliella salina]|uniref:Uncharacterized protein n=1 Tax=Dunaliella salina TaxID=3046 RepID=A0ABQ7FVA6_DUNSA|nr:hypothetical protein DUNSADRAFT_3529 [Dunaliella salina]|eukprot:KAF5826323.1 hypothetical protein DUNSADRAFT_3529 [Dunaliella salina]
MDHQLKLGNKQSSPNDETQKQNGVQQHNAKGGNMPKIWNTQNMMTCAAERREEEVVPLLTEALDRPRYILLIYSCTDVACTFRNSEENCPGNEALWQATKEREAH